MSQDIIDACAPHGVIPVGLIDVRAEKDRYDNDVSLVQMCDGARYRIVHHTPAGVRRGRATVYAGRGVFVRMRTYSPTRDTEAHTIEIAGYHVAWGDGDNLGASFSPPEGGDREADPALLIALGQIGEDNFDLVVVTVLAAIAGDDAAWERKPTSRFSARGNGGS